MSVSFFFLTIFERGVGSRPVGSGAQPRTQSTAIKRSNVLTFLGITTQRRDFGRGWRQYYKHKVLLLTLRKYIGNFLVSSNNFLSTGYDPGCTKYRLSSQPWLPTDTHLKNPPCQIWKSNLNPNHTTKIDDILIGFITNFLSQFRYQPVTCKGLWYVFEDN